MEGVRNRFGYGVGLDFLGHMIDTGRVNLVTYRAAKATATQAIRIKTGAKVLHFVGVIKAGLAFPYQFYEGVTVSVAGTELTRVNPKRSAADSLLESRFYSGATASGGVSLKDTQAGFGTNPGQASSGEGQDGFYWELLPNTEYLIEGTPEAETNVCMEFLAFETEA